MRPRLSDCRGFTLIEALIAMLVLGIGALATVMLLLHSLRSSRDSAMQSFAMHMAGELAELRAFHQSTGLPGDTPFAFDIRLETPPAATPGCLNIACPAQDFAATEITAWQRRLSQILPQVRAVLCRDSQSPDETPAWQCDGAMQSPAVLKMRWSTASSQADNKDNNAPPLMVVVLGR